MAESFPSTLLRSNAHIEPLSPGLWSATAPDDRGAAYDKVARAYDFVVGNSIYNHVIWGCPAKTYAAAASAMIARFEDWALDFGCGSLVFTARAYAGHEDRLILFDRSLAMLQRGRDRLPEGKFIQGDAFAPPFAPRAFSGAMAWGMLHLFGGESPFLDALAALLKPAAPVATSSLILSGRSSGDAMLRALHRRGEAAEPETRASVETAFARRFHCEGSNLIGSMLFLTGRAR